MSEHFEKGTREYYGTLGMRVNFTAGRLLTALIFRGEKDKEGWIVPQPHLRIHVWWAVAYKNRLWWVESLAVLIPSVLLAASYIYTKLSYNKLSSSPSFKSVLPSPSLAFQTTPSTFQQISSFNPFGRFNYLQTFPECSFPNLPDTFLIPLPVSLSSKCDTRPLHPLANTSSKPLVPLVWFTKHLRCT